MKRYYAECCGTVATFETKTERDAWCSEFHDAYKWELITSTEARRAMLKALAKTDCYIAEHISWYERHGYMDEIVDAYENL